MHGLMMDIPLTLLSFLDRAGRLFAHREVVTQKAGELERTSYGEIVERCGRLARVLERLGIRPGDRVATLAWNDSRHLELYLAVPSMGAVLHPLNLRLPPEQLTYIANHAEDRVLFVDPSLLPLVEKLAPGLATIEHVVVLGDETSGDALPETSLAPVYAYEALLADAEPSYPWPRLDERQAAAMCYTSGTTGLPKGVVYSHRSIVLHTLGLSLPDALDLSERDVFLPVVPMFHAMAWGTPFACTMLGATQVFPGPHLAPRDLAELIQGERVTLTAGVPTLWMGLLQLLETEPYDIGSLRGLVVGGSAAPRAMIEGFARRHDLPVIHAWGMTETSPLGSVSRLHRHQLELPEEERFRLLARQGTPVPGVEIRAVDEDGREIPWDGESFGELEVRGPWVAAGYYRSEEPGDRFHDGWFRTGDVVTIDPEGSILIVDRTKDLIKSGGEWISSQELENALMAHPGVREAAVIAVAHPKWQERPLACVVPRADLDTPLTREQILEHLRPRFPRMYLPDDVVFVEEIPKTSVGKFDKKALRQRFEGYRLPDPPA